MSRKLGLILFFLILLMKPMLTCAQEKDTVYLRNGQVLIGKLLSISLGVIEFDDADLNVQNIRYHKIKTISAGSRTFRIETIDKNFYYGVLKPSEDYGKVIVDNSLESKTYPIADIYELRVLEKHFIKKIKGTIAFGYSYTRSSDIGRRNFDLNLNFTEQKFNVGLAASSIFTNNQGDRTRDREGILLTGFYDIDAVWITGLLLNYQRNIELGLDRRFQQGIGGGRRLLLKNNLLGNLISGLVVNQERDLEGNSSGNLFEYPIQFSLNYFHYSKPNIQVTFTSGVYFGLNQDGRKRFDGETRLNWEAVSNLNLSLQFYSSYDNASLAGSNNNFDYGIVFNVGYKLK
jgi:hypothetical protein